MAKEEEKARKKAEKEAKFAAKKAAGKGAPAGGEKKAKKPAKSNAPEVVTYGVDTKPGDKKSTTCELPKSYSPKYVEAAWSTWWDKQGSSHCVFLRYD